MNVHAIVLAAGRSSRLGTPKQLVNFQGEPLVRRTAKTCLAAQCDQVHVIVGYDAEAIIPVLTDMDIRVVINPDWEEGIASSIRAGIQAASEADAVLITPCDLPLLVTEHLNRLIDEYLHRAELVASSWNDVVGVPAIFSNYYFAFLRELKGDTGARKVLQRHIAKVRLVPFPDGEFDIDTAEAWEQLKRLETQ